MKKNTLFIFIVMLSIIALLSQPAFAQENKKFSVGLRGSYNTYQDDNMNFFPIEVGTSFDDAFGISADFSYYFTNFFSLELSIGYTQTDMNTDSFLFGRERYGELTQIPILLSARYHFDYKQRAVPYFGAGIGYFINDMDNADGNGEFFDGAPPGVESFCDDAFGYHFNVGVDILLIEHLVMNIDIKYAIMETDIGYNGAGYDESSETDIKTLSTGLGIKYYF